MFYTEAINTSICWFAIPFTFNDVAADSVTFGSGHRIGAYVRFISNGTKWVAINMGNHTMTIATD